MAAAVYILCALTSLLCAVLLFRSWSRTKAKLLFWCSIGFAGFALNNILLFIDVIVFPDVTYILKYRTLPALIGMMVMIYGFIMEEI